MEIYDLIIVGGGISGMLCAINSKKQGVENILLIEKDGVLGGSTNLLSYALKNNKYKSSTEYKEALTKEISTLNIEVRLNTLVININNNKNLICVSPTKGVQELSSKAIVLANGSKEKGLNTLEIAGDRSSGVISLKTAKKIFNMSNVIPGKNIAVCGDKNLSYIEEDFKSHNVNIVALISTDNNHYNLTNNIYSDYKLISLKGKGRLSSIIISNGFDTKEISCDCLIFAQGLLSDGLVSFRSGIALNPSTTGPMVNDNFETSMKNVFACGDGIYIHTSLEAIEEESLALVSTLVKILK